MYSMLKANGGEAFEIVFVSEDPDEAAFKAYLAEMPRQVFIECLEALRLSSRISACYVSTVVIGSIARYGANVHGCSWSYKLIKYLC